MVSDTVATLSCYTTVSRVRRYNTLTMKVLKKIKARIGLSHKQSHYSPPAQPLEFHPVHGDNIMLSANNTIAARLVFTNNLVSLSDKLSFSFQFSSHNLSNNMQLVTFIPIGL